jgi:4-amino-4-deoxy-L-arabinose transferase-like glycosyltransferase
MLDRQKKTLVACIIVSILLRVGAAFYLGNQVTDLPGTFDQISYHLLAQRIVGGYGFSFGSNWWPMTAANAPTAHWSFLYTLYLSGVYALFGQNPLVARIIQALLVGMLQPYLAFLLGRRLFGSVVGLAAAGLIAVYTYFVYYAACLMTESFYITAILAALYLALRLVSPEKVPGGGHVRLALALGLVLGMAVLLRQLFLLFVPFLFLWLFWYGRKRQIGTILVAGAVIAAMILPFTLFNYARFHRFVLLNTNAGYAFFWGNHPIYGTHFVPILTPDMGSYQELIPKELHSLDEAALDQALLARGIRFIIDDPVRYTLLSASRIPPYFMFWPSSGSGMVSNVARVAGFGLYLPFMLLGLWLSFSKKDSSRSGLILLYLFVAVYSLIHLLTWTLIRYRLPVDAVLIIFAALAVVHLAMRVPTTRRMVVSNFGIGELTSLLPAGHTPQNSL